MRCLVVKPFNVKIAEQNIISILKYKKLQRLTASSAGHICNEGIFARLIEMKYVQLVLVHISISHFYVHPKLTT